MNSTETFEIKINRMAVDVVSPLSWNRIREVMSHRWADKGEVINDDVWDVTFKMTDSDIDFWLTALAFYATGAEDVDVWCGDKSTCCAAALASIIEQRNIYFDADGIPMAAADDTTS